MEHPEKFKSFKKPIIQLPKGSKFRHFVLVSCSLFSCKSDLV